MKNNPAPRELRPRQILLSKRANVFYLEHARILQKNERIVYLTDQGEDVANFFNIPERNTSLILLGKGCSITDAAVRRLAESNVSVGFCGSGGTPCFGVTEPVFLTGQSEYRPTQYMQAWAKKWFDDAARLDLAKELLHYRIDLVKKAWKDPALPESLENSFRRDIDTKTNSQELMLAEGAWAKQLYRLLAQSARVPDFSRKTGREIDESEPAKTPSQEAGRINGFLDHGNYLAYGLAVVALNGLGISFAFPLLHGKTRRGALVFDIADVIKDAYVMPLAFSCGANPKIRERDFRAMLIEKLHSVDALDLLFDLVKTLATKNT